MKKVILLVFMGLCLSYMGQAQDYKTGIGIRGGYFNGLTVKHFVGPKAALEGILSSRWRGIQLTGLYEIHNQAFNATGLKWFYGFGAHVGFWDGNQTKWGKEDTDYTVAGIDGILGLEYTFAEAPINIGIDWKPSMNLIGYSEFWADGGALSIRFVF